MKIVNTFGRDINAYQQADLDKVKPIIDKAQKLWLETWKSQGELDEGSCCGGKCIQVPFLRKRARTIEYLPIVHCNFVQGNVSAQRAVKPVLEYLKNEGLEAVYDDGWMN